MKIFGERVKQELEAQDKKQKDLCEYLNVNKSTLSAWLNALSVGGGGWLKNFIKSIDKLKFIAYNIVKNVKKVKQIFD